MDRSGCSTASSLSGVYRNIMQSPNPICMFYFGHPFGIQTPSGIGGCGNSTTITNNSTPTCEFYFGGRDYRYNQRRKNSVQQQQTQQQQQNRVNNVAAGVNARRRASLVPWPRNTWSRDSALPPLLQILARQYGRKLPDIETIIQTVRQAWNTPNSRSLLQSRDEAEFTTSFWDVSSNTHYNVYQMGVGTTNGTTMIAAGPGLLKRRYSVPEIIMRKHSLAQQKSYEESIALATAPTSVGSGGIKSKLTSDYRNGNGGNNSSSMNMGSDSNLSRSYAPSSCVTMGNNNNNNNNTGQNNPSVQHSSSGNNKSSYSNGHVMTGTGCIGSVYERNVEYSMRKELLRRLWSKDMKIVGRPSSLSPPSRRTTPRRLCFNSTTLTENPHQCEECQKLGVDRNSENNINNNNGVDSTPKRLKLSAGRSLDSSVIINHNNVIKNKSSPSESSSRPTTDSSQPIHSTTTASSAIQRADESISDFSDNTYINNNKKEEQIRKSVLIYMTSLENSLMVEQNASELLRVEIDAPTTGDTSTHIESDFADKTQFEESADSGNGDATQNLDNYSSGSVSGGEDTENRETAENIKNNNNLLLSNTDNDNTISDDNKNGNNETSNDDYVSNLIIDNLNANGSTVPDNENTSNKSRDTSRQTSVSNKSQEEIRNYKSYTGATNDSENNLLELIEKSHELALVESAVSEALIRNDKNGNKWNRSSPSPPLQYNEIVRADTIFPERSYPQHPTALHITSQSSTGHIQDVIVRDGTMSYFPSYSLVESRGDVSSYTSHASDQEPEAIGHVNSGSAYPELDYPYQVVVTRLSAIPRTMSMEVQPSSTSAEEELDGAEYDSCDDDSISLVDSLDDPLSPRPNRKIRPKKSAEAFFIPINDPSHRIDDNLLVSDAMPDSLKERLDSRQIRREMKKESDQKRKRWKVEQYSFEKISRKPVKVINRVARKENIPLPRKSKSKPFRESSSSSVVSSSKRPSNVKPQNKNGLRKEIGMLESYKIDARGNMQFKAGKTVQEPVTSRRAFKALPLDEPFVREPVVTSQKKSSKSKPEREQVSRSVPKPDRIDERRKQIIKDVQQMTLYQQADLTPDIEGGPRRMYQKTEIQEGDKRIEILEIVECVDTTPESSPAKWSRGGNKTPRNSGLMPRVVVPQRSSKTPKTSKIIVESNKSNTGQKGSSKSLTTTSKTPKSSGVQRSSRSNSRDSSPNPTNPNKDRAIADMLIDAMNSNEDPNVEFVQSPKDHLKPSGKRTVSRKVVTNGGSSRRSANSGKYLHQFEVIPEEKSGMSFDSSNEEAASSRAASQAKEPAVKKISEEEDESISKTENSDDINVTKDNETEGQIESTSQEDTTSVQESEFSKDSKSSVQDLQRKSSKDSNDSATEGSVKSTFSSKTSIIVRHETPEKPEKLSSRPSSRQDMHPEPKQDTIKKPAVSSKGSSKSPTPMRKTSLTKNTKETKSNDCLVGKTKSKIESKTQVKPQKYEVVTNNKPTSRTSVQTSASSKLTPNTLDILNGNVSSASSKSESIKSQIAKSPVKSNLVDKSGTHLSPQNSSERARAAVKGEVATSKGWGNFSKPYHGSPAESANEDENASHNRSVSPNQSLSSMNHHHQHHINHNHKNNNHRPSVTSLATTNDSISTHFTSQNHDPLFNLGSIMSPAAYTNAPTTSCGLELSYGASLACQPQYHNHCALSPPSSVTVNNNFHNNTQKSSQPPLTSESIDGCNNIMRIIDQTFRDNPDIFTDNYLKRFHTENNDTCPPGTSSITGETIVSRDLTMTLKYDDIEDKKELSTSCITKSKCDCMKGSGTKCKEENSWQVIEANDCKLIQQRIEYFESFCPDADPDMNSKSLFLYKENKIISGDGGVSRKNEIKVGKSVKNQQICSDSHDSGYANASSNDLNREKSACSDCCYCNPQLHNDPNNKAESCVYCRNKTPNIDQETIPDTPCSMHGYYETMKKSNHVHTRIKSRESDTVSVKCTKTNERIKRSCCPNDCSASFPEKSERPERKVDPKGSKVGHLSRPKDVNNILHTTNVQKVEKEIHDKISPKSNKHHTMSKQSLIKEKPKEIRLPSPYKCISSNSYESTSDSSCSLNCSPTKRTTLPQAHWQQQTHTIPVKNKNHSNIKAKTTTNTLPRASRTNSHSIYHHHTVATTPEHKLTNANKNLHDSHVYEENLDITNANHQRHHYDRYTTNHHQMTNNNDDDNNENNVNTSEHYNNFVNNNNINANDNNCTSPNIITTCHTTTNNVNTNGNNMTTTAAWSVTVQGNYAAELAPNVDLKLSFPGKQISPQKTLVQNLNSNWAKRSSAHPANKWAPMSGPPPSLDQMPLHGKAPPALPAANSFNPKKNLTREVPTVSNWIRTPVQNLPGILAPEDQNIGNRERKGLKRFQSVANMITRMKGLGGGGESRAMSFQSINRMQGGERFFDQTTDPSRSTTTQQRRMSMGSEAPSDMTLSVSGARIAPETKPKVPTMSEKDLTRKKGSSFTRNTQMRYQY